MSCVRSDHPITGFNEEEDDVSIHNTGRIAVSKQTCGDFESSVAQCISSEDHVLDLQTRKVFSLLSSGRRSRRRFPVGSFVLHRTRVVIFSLQKCYVRAVG